MVGEVCLMDRYTYGANNPKKYWDPTGYAVCAAADCSGPSYKPAHIPDRVWRATQNAENSREYQTP